MNLNLNLNVCQLASEAVYSFARYRVYKKWQQTDERRLRILRYVCACQRLAWCHWGAWRNSTNTERARANASVASRRLARNIRHLR